MVWNAIRLSYRIQFGTNRFNFVLLKPLKMLIYSFCFRLPFEWHEPCLYFVAFAIEYLILFVVLMCVTNLVFLVVGFCSFLVLFARNIETELDYLKLCSKSHLSMKIYSLVQFHSKAKQLSSNITWLKFIYSIFIYFRISTGFSHFYRIIVITYFGWSTTNICLSLLQIHLVS